MGAGAMLSTLMPGPRASTASRTVLASSAAQAVMANAPATIAGRIFFNIGTTPSSPGEGGDVFEHARRFRFPRLLHGASSARVMHGVKAFETFFRHQRVYLCRAEGAVAQEHLQRA